MMDNRGGLATLSGCAADIEVLGELDPGTTLFMTTESRRPAGVDIRFGGGSSSPERGHIFGSRPDMLPVVMVSLMLMPESSLLAVGDS
jgi:hypothetical protein